MKTDILLGHKYKRIGWILLIPTFIISIIVIISENDGPEMFDAKVPALLVDEFMGDFRYFAMIENNIFNEILGVTLIISLLLVAFSKERVEDEYITKIRLDSLVKAVILNYLILILAFVTVYDLSFYWVMLGNMFTTLILFILIFNINLNKLKNTAEHEE